MTGYFCRDCGHRFGVFLPNRATITLHRVVSHSGDEPIEEKK